jgi:hypothetical protein
MNSFSVPRHPDASGRQLDINDGVSNPQSRERDLSVGRGMWIKRDPPIQGDLDAGQTEYDRLRASETGNDIGPFVPEGLRNVAAMLLGKVWQMLAHPEQALQHVPCLRRVTAFVQGEREGGGIARVRAGPLPVRIVPLVMHGIRARHAGDAIVAEERAVSHLFQ